MNQADFTFSTASRPSQLRITDIRIADISGAPMRCPLIKISTNQGLEGYGEVRDGADPVYALLLKRHLLGENPCDVDRLFKRMKQFGHHARQGGGVCGIEVALMDLAAKAYGVPAYMLLGGKYRDKLRIYCDTDVDGKDTGEAMGQALKARIEQGYTFLKMDLGIGQIRHIEGALSAPLGYFEARADLVAQMRKAQAEGNMAEVRYIKNRLYDIENTPHPYTGIHVTEKGLEALENYVATVRGVIGYEVPLAVDHFGHIGLEDCIKLAKRIEKYNLAWLEDMIPWQYTDKYVRLSKASTTPICTGEDIYLKEGFQKLIDAGGVSVIHPDILTSGGMLETKRIGDYACEHGVAVAMHMAESPIACLAAAHTCASFEHFLALEFHSNDVPWWQDMVNYAPGGRIVDHGWITLTEAPGLGIASLNDEVLAEHLTPGAPGLWLSTEEWNGWFSNDRLWS
ncbi:MAG: mandelate racemase/muconate lactonizing enzyme family protein [Oscillospiraceae bacterium]|jgi:L-alanine-DL-glutamate epimerase-like enolase superfamily enzyme|nr:mandelate racemase/muconate lactonizing enzyme family protein [Oscillospiraceae bacterium]